MNKEKTLSQQICELCGIKPYKKKHSYSTKQGKKWIQWWQGKYECTEPEIIKRRNGESLIFYSLHYLNFKNPENFVKLLELKTETNGTVLDIISTDYNISTCENVLECLTLRIRARVASDIDEIKQAIHNYDGWVWG